MEYGLGTAAALGGVAATVFGMPELGIPLIMGGIGMDTGQAIGGNKGGLLGGLAGGAAGMGAEGLGAGALGIPQLFGEGAAGASAVDTAAQGAATAAQAAPAAASTAPVTGTLAQVGPTMQAQVAPEAQADIAAAPGATAPASAGGSPAMKLGTEALKAGGPSIANMLGGGGQQALQVPPPPARPAQPQVPVQSTGPASTASAVPTPNPMAALADYHSFLSDIYKPVAAA